MNSAITDPVVIETARLYEGIGRIVVSFQQIEQWLAEILAMLLHMREKDDQFLVSAAMSFGQKVDLLVELYPKRKTAQLKDVDLIVVKNALSTAEEFRNRVVHSFWAIECADEARWIRIKGSLRGRKGLKLSKTSANIEMLHECDGALLVIREWMLKETSKIEVATATLKAYMSDGYITTPNS
jgi:hypothetical protein